MPPAFEVLLLNTAIPQIQAAQSGDTYLVPRDIAFSTVANLANGTNLLPSLTFSSDTNTGIYREGADALGFTAGGGTNQMVLTSTGLGIGTNNPSGFLANKLVIATGGTANEGITIYSSSNNGSLWFADATTGAGRYAGGIDYQHATNELIFYSNSQGNMRLDSSGNLGLGVTPSAWGSAYKALQVGYAALSNPTATYDTLNLTANLWHDGTNWRFIETQQANRFSTIDGIWTWEYATGSAGAIAGLSTQMTLDASGNLGVGVTSVNPTGLAILSGGQGKGVLIARNSSGSPTSGQSLGSYAFKGIADGVNTNVSSEAMIEAVAAENQSGSTAATNMLFYTKPSGTGPGSAPTERARITSGGYFKASNGGTYVGSTNSYHELRKTEDQGDWTAFINHAGATASNQYGVRVNLDGDPNGAGNEFLYCSGGAVASSTLRTSIRSNGGIANYQANDANLSDRREKTNFAPAKSYLDTICAIPVQTFNYIDQSEDDSGLTLGVVAQDVQAVAPELVTESNWGTEDNPKMRLSIYQTDLQYALMKCIQELKSELDSVKAELAALKGA